eukprot:TRINITY_DN7518_c0_g1_i2.p1 TRINITY_DN7518_c0_g1~~TRINITY_DN7518_c0_g1_i2.p1  ORF type:complete len:221 (+),score=50.46 TRINITY_DN7518_c0_g1_i2:103-765(+)
MYIQDLEDKVKRLGAKIEELQLKAAKAAKKRGTDPSQEERLRQEEQATIKQQLAQLIRQPQLSSGEQQQLQELLGRFVTNSRQRMAQVEHYLDRVEESATPGVQVKFALWGLDQNEDFYNDEGLWSSLMFKELGLTPQQAKQLQDRRQAVHRERVALAHTERMLQQLRTHILHSQESLNREMDALRQVLSPLQLAKFYVWVEQNEWCMQMLNAMWNNVDH